MPSLILYNGAIPLDLSNKVTNWTPEIEPSFSFLDLANGSIAKKEDLGNSSDKFYVTLDLCLPISGYVELRNFYPEARGKALLLTTDLDLFLPSIVSSSVNVMIVECKPVGYPDENIMSDHRLVTLRLLYLDSFTFGASFTATAKAQALSLIDRLSVWTNEFTYSDSVQVKSLGQGYTFKHFTNDSSLWTVDFNLLSKTQACYLIVWILSLRTDFIDIDLSPRNANSSRDVVTRCNIRDFTLRREGNFYSLTLDVVER